MTISRAQIDLVWLGLRIILGLILSLGWVEADPSEAEKDFALGQQYQTGQGVPQDYAQAMIWYQKAADLGSVAAQIHIGDLYYRGQGVPQDYAQAMDWFQKAAAQGNSSAQYNIGGMYYKGHGVPQDYAQAMIWYQKAAALGDTNAQCGIGVLYESGQGVPQDDVQAMSWFKKAADRGYANAQYCMGVLYEMNRGIPQDHSQAMNWFQKSADKGFAAAEFNVGLFYDEGLGVPQDYAQAMSWYQKAAAQGVGEAQNNIGSLYEYGRGVPVNVKTAVEWYKKAAANHCEKATMNLARLADLNSGVRPGFRFSFVSAFYVFVVVWVLWRMLYPGMYATEIFLENVIDIAPGVEGGDIRISVLGKSTSVTQGQKSTFPQTTKKICGWCQWMGADGHVLEIRKVTNLNTTFKTFQPARISPHQQIIITNWGFTDKNKCVVIASTVVGQGYDCFIKYEIETSRVLGQVAEKTAFADLPQWALWQLNPT